MPTTHDLIKKAISNERTRMVDDGEVEDFVDINRGFCEDFAFEVMAIVMNVAGRKSDELGIADVSIANFVKVDPSTGCAYDYGGSFDRDLLAERYPATQPLRAAILFPRRRHVAQRGQPSAYAGSRHARPLKGRLSTSGGGISW